jgi:hypothetical protein
MPKNSRTKKGKQPLHPRRGPDGRWLAPPPDPEPPDDQGAESAHLVTIPDETPVTTGGLVIREPSPRLSPPGPPVSPQAGEVAVRRATDNGEQATQQPPFLPVVAAIARLSPERPQDARRQAQVTVETVTNEEVGPSRRAPTPIHRAYARMERASPESEQRDSVLGNPVARSTAQDAFQGNTRSPSVSSITPSVNKSRSSRNTQTIKRVMREHAERAEARAQSAYEQNRAALDLISKSMDNVRNAFIEAKHARDRYHDILSVSSRSRQNARRHADPNASSAHRADSEAIDRSRKVAGYQRRLRTQVLGPEERQEAHPSSAISWRLRSGMHPASLSWLAEAENASMDLSTEVSTAKLTPTEAPRKMNAHRMRVREWVAHQREITAQRSTPEESDPVRRRAASPVTRAEDVFARHNPINTAPPAQKRTAGERVSWLDWLNQPSTSRPFGRDPPPHRPTHPNRGTAAGAPGGSSPGSSSSSLTTIRTPRTPQAPRTPRRQGSPNPSSRDESRVPEYLRSRRSPTFEPVASGGNLTPARTPHQRGAAAPAPALQGNTPGRRRERAQSIDFQGGGHNRLGRRDGTDKITNMLSVAFISEAQVADRVDTVPIHKLGIKSPLPKAYEGQPDQTSFENWLSLLLGFFRIHQLDVLNEVQDRARIEILGQSLKDNAHTYFRERHQKLLEQGEIWDFREAILDLRDRYLYKNTPFVAARKFETLMQGTRDAQALCDELTTQASRMVEYPSDYHFRLRFMLALRPEVLEYIIKTHSVSAELSTLAQIRSACEDYERSNEYGKQLAATQALLGGSRAPVTYESSRAQSNAGGHTKPSQHPQRTLTSSTINETTTITARPHGEGQSRTTPIRMTPELDSKTKPAARHGQRNETTKVSCFICEGPHYARDCPPESRKVARGYAVRIANQGDSAPIDDENGGYQSSGSVVDGRIAQSPEPDSQDSGDGHSNHPEGEQYDPDEVNAYQFSSSDDSEPLFTRATRIIATAALNKIESRAAKASKPTPPKAPNVESNRARYKIGNGPQPQRDSRLQRCIEVTVPINGLPARVLLDGGSNTNMLSPEFATVAKVPAIELQEQMTLQLAVTGSRSKINYGTWVPMEFGPIKATTYFDIANIEGYDAILGTPFLWEHGVSPIYENDGWVMRNGKRIYFPSLSSTSPNRGQSFRN